MPDGSKHGKIKKQSKHISVIVIPHSQSNVKVFKFSTFHSKFYGILALTLAIVLVVSFCIFITYTLYENNKLQESNTNLVKMNEKQQDMLDTTSNELKILREKDEDFKQKAKDFTEKFKEITDKYITGSKTSRSGDRNERTFVDDITNLKDTLTVMKEISGSPDEVSDAFSDAESKLEKYMKTIPTLWPASGRLSSHFGGRQDPFITTTKFHAGIDIAADYGDRVLSSADGTVIEAGWRSGYGYAVVISHGRGVTTLYGHNSKLLVNKGQQVKKGDLIAYVGSSGRSTGAHLHFEIRINDEPVDPLKYLDK